jgi:hypothetical protein
VLCHRSKIGSVVAVWWRDLGKVEEGISRSSPQILPSCRETINGLVAEHAINPLTRPLVGWVTGFEPATSSSRSNRHNVLTSGFAQFRANLVSVVVHPDLQLYGAIITHLQ